MSALVPLLLTACNFQKTEVVRPPLPDFTPRPPTTIQIAPGEQELKQVSYINQGGLYNNEAMAVVGSRVYLRGPSGSNGTGVLWFERPVGSTLPMAPSPIPMVNPGSDDDPTYLTASGTNVFFRARNASGKYSVYSYGGTGSPVQLPPVSAMGGNNDDPRTLTAWGTRLCYSAFDGSNQRLFCTLDAGACWTSTSPAPSPTPSSTGTPAPCLTPAPAVRDSVSPNLGPFYPSNFSAGSDALFFIGYLGSEYRPYRYDGTSLTAEALPRPSIEGDVYTYPDWIGVAGSDAYFTATSSIDSAKRIFRWRSDLNQVEKLPNPPASNSYPRYPTVVGNDLYYVDYASTGAQHVFKYNATSGLTEFATGNSSGYSYPSNTLAWRGSFYFFDYDDDYVMRLFKIDPTGTAPVKMTGPSLPDVPNWPGEPKGGQTKLYFGARNTNPARNQSQLFYSDSSYIYSALPIADRWDSDTPRRLTPFNTEDVLFIVRIYTNGVWTDQLYYYNGTTIRQLAMQAQGGNDQIAKIVVSSNNHDMFFTAYNNINGYDAFHYDGQNLYPLTKSDGGAVGQVGYNAIGASGAKAFFAATDQRTGLNRLFVYPGTGDPSPIPLPSSGPTSMTISNNDVKIQEYAGSIYFSALSGSGWNLYKLDPTTYAVSAVSITAIGYVSDLRIVGDKLFIVSNWGSSSYIYDGTTLEQITNVNWISTMANGGSGSVTYFSAYGSQGQRLYQFTGGVTSQLSNINAGNDQVYSVAVTSGGLVIFDATDSTASVAGNYLWVYDPAGTDPVRLPSTGNGAGGYPDSPYGLTAVGTKVYFSARNVDGRTRLFVTDGVTVKKVCSINASGDDSPNLITPVGDDIFFTARNSNNVYKVFIYSPLKPSLGCRQVAESNPGGDDQPSAFNVMNGHLYFTGQYGGTQYFRALFRY